MNVSNVECLSFCLKSICKVLLKYTEHSDPHESRSNKDISQVIVVVVVCCLLL